MLQTQLPADLHPLIAGATWEEIRIGCSGVQVFRLAGGGCPTGYLKIAGAAYDLAPEAERLRWLRGRLPVPELRYFAANGTGQQVMLMSEIPGLVAFHERFRDRWERIIDLLAQGLRQIHCTAITGCPFDQRIDSLIEIARANIRAGRIRDNTLNWLWEGCTAQSLLDEVLATRPAGEDLVFVHGDYCLPNVLIDPDTMTLTGFIDWGSAGIADRHYDLMAVARSIAYNCGDEWVAPFYRAYGLPDVDPARIRFFQMLDDLVWPAVA